ncbi:unnamed protein product, partial [Mycena citricolor]
LRRLVTRSQGFPTHRASGACSPAAGPGDYTSDKYQSPVRSPTEGNRSSLCMQRNQCSAQQCRWTEISAHLRSKTRPALWIWPRSFRHRSLVSLSSSCNALPSTTCRRHRATLRSVWYHHTGHKFG